MSSTKKASWPKRNFVYLLGFLVPFLILGMIFAKNQIVPFGDNIYLRSDMYHQYAPFIRNCMKNW